MADPTATGDKLAIIARIDVQPDHAEEAEELLRGLIEAAAGEDGTEVYALHRDGPSFWFWELYRDAEALAEHGKSPALAEAFGGRLSSLLAGPPELHTVTPLAAKGLSL